MDQIVKKNLLILEEEIFSSRKYPGTSYKVSLAEPGELLMPQDRYKTEGKNTSLRTDIFDAKFEILSFGRDKPLFISNVSYQNPFSHREMKPSGEAEDRINVTIFLANENEKAKFADQQQAPKKKFWQRWFGK